MSLTRKHALLAVDDDAIYRKMEKYCRVRSKVLQGMFRKTGGYTYEDGRARF